MRLVSDVFQNTAKSMLWFSIAALALAFMDRSGQSNIVLRIVIELPLLLLLSLVFALPIHGVAAGCGAVPGGNVLVSALVSLALGWAVAGGGKSSFAGLGYHDLLQPAFALSLGAPWLLKAIFRRS